MSFGSFFLTSFFSLFSCFFGQLKREQMLEQQAAQQRQLELQQREQQEKQQLQQLLAKKDKPSKSLRRLIICIST